MSSTLQGASALTATLSVPSLTNAGLVLDIGQFSYSILGRTYVKSAGAPSVVIEPGSGLNPLNPNSFVSIPGNSLCAFSLFVDEDGIVTVAQGPIFERVDQKANFPVPPSNKAMFGGFVVQADGGWLAGSDSFAETNDVWWFTFSTHPGRPLSL